MRGHAKLVLTVLGITAIAYALTRPASMREPEPVRFTAAQPQLFAAGGTLTDAWADIDSDGDPDRFVGFNDAPSRLYRNDGTATTELQASSISRPSSGALRSGPSAPRLGATSTRTATRTYCSDTPETHRSRHSTETTVSVASSKWRRKSGSC